MAARGWWKASRVVRSCRILGALFLVLLAWTDPAAAITYIYDELGRLVGVVDPAGNTAVYTYDAVGNILSIQNFPSTTVSIIEFTPNSGAVNATVTIYGTGYSTTPSSNTVTFNGVAATVTSSTATSIVTKVPTGATTGPIAVTAPGGSATSSTNFVVAAATGAPTITSFTPTIGLPGTAVTVTGTNFDPAPANDKLFFDTSVRQGLVSAATPTQLSTTAPPLVGSGHLKVTTPTGAATSSGDFFIPPPGFATTDIQVTGRMVYGGAAKTITITTAGKYAMETFDVTAGQGILVKVTNQTWAQAALNVLKPDNTSLWPYSQQMNNNILIFGTAPGSGGHTLFASPGTGTGSVTLQVGAPDFTVTALTVPVTQISPNQNGSYTFTFSYTVKNQGSIDAGLPTQFFLWTDRFYLSTNNTWDPADIQVGSLGFFTYLSAGATYSYPSVGITTSTTIASGSYYVIAFTDADGQIPESSESNNTRASATAITLLGRPDLVPTVLTIPTNPVVRNGDGTWSIPLSYTIANQGASTALHSWLDLVYLSTDAVLDGGDYQFAGAYQEADVAAGGNYTRSGTWNVANTIAPGDYYVILKANTDTIQHLAEVTESNNVLVSATRVTLLP